MNRKRAIRIFLSSLLSIVALGSMVTSCSAVYEDSMDCDDIVKVHLKYDYNTARADMRRYHVGWVRVYAVDENGIVEAYSDCANTAGSKPLAREDFSADFKALKGGRYTFKAVAFQAPYEDLAAGEGARFDVDFPQVGEKYEDLLVKLRKTSTKAVMDPSDFEVVAPKCGLDTLWMTLDQGRYVDVRPLEQQTGIVLRDTISLIRDTKYLHITLLQIEDQHNIHASDFMVRIVDNNATIGHDNTVLPDSDMDYIPFAAWTTALSQNGVAYYSDEAADLAPAEDPIVERAAHFDISFSRLMYYLKGAGENARLQIARVESGKNPEVVVDINLPYYLAFGRGAYDIYHYSEQEYLDREYDYNLDFFLQAGKWKYVNVRVSVMNWSKRFQQEIL